MTKNLYERLLTHKAPHYDTPDQFLSACVEYFRWAEENPLKEENVWQYRGAIVRTDVDKMRPFSKRALASYLNIPVSRLDLYAKRADPQWSEAVEMVEQIIYNQKFEGAVAGLMNATIIGRDLGLAEKQELSAPDGPIEQVVVYGLPDNGRS